MSPWALPFRASPVTTETAEAVIEQSGRRLPLVEVLQQLCVEKLRRFHKAKVPAQCVAAVAHSRAYQSTALTTVESGTRFCA
jgi:hypothetical protein